MAEETRQRIKNLLIDLYGADTGDQVYQSLLERLVQFSAPEFPNQNANRRLFDQKDVILITYGDMVKDPDSPPLKTLHDFYRAFLQSIINTVHILPFFPYSSDDGFSIIDYKEVDPDLGSWQDIEKFKDSGSRMMFDAVINHISSKSKWFKGFLRGDERYKDYFITVDPQQDLSLVTRPRSLPLLTPFETVEGEKYVWTTFSADQVDLNYANPEVLLDVLDVILFYIERGANLIRLDAIAYLWKEIETTCIHLPQTHAVVKLLRAVIDEIAPTVLLITETNVPHEENVSYFGNGKDEAHLVYQFSLPPLTAHALLTGSSAYLREWAKSLKLPSDQTSFFNFTASHDGVGVRPVTGILPEKELETLLMKAQAHGGRISSKNNSDGTTSPYELNINYFDLINDPFSNEDRNIQVDRFIASQAMMLMLKGIPGVYLHSIVGSRNDYSGVQKSGQARSINREKLNYEALSRELRDGGSLRNAVFRKYQRLLKIRIREKAFHPSGEQHVIDVGDSVFAVIRTSLGRSEKIIALQNVTEEVQEIDIAEAIVERSERPQWVDVISGKSYSIPSLVLNPYQTIWLKYPE